jgi:hypothetical protein
MPTSHPFNVRLTMCMVLPLRPLSALIMWLLDAWETLLILNALCVCLAAPPSTCLYYSSSSVCFSVLRISMCVNTSTTGLSSLLVKFSVQSHLHSLVNFTEFVGKTHGSWRLDTARHLPLSLRLDWSVERSCCDELFGLVWNCVKGSLTPKINTQILVQLI